MSSEDFDTIEIDTKLIQLMYEVWLVTLPYAKHTWKCDVLFPMKRTCYVTGSRVQMLDFFHCATNDSDFIQEDRIMFPIVLRGNNYTEYISILISMLASILDTID